MRRLLSSVVAAAALSGCGLLLDASPPDQGFDAAVRPDAGPAADAGSMDAGARDGGAIACTRTDDCPTQACSEVDCVAGVCVRTGTPIDCDDGIACTEDTCDPRTGCVSTPNDGLCPVASDDGCRVNRCIPREGGCQRRADHDACEDTYACTLDRCVLLTGECTSEPSNAFCASALGRGSLCDPADVPPEDDLGCVPPSCGEDSDCRTECRPDALCMDGSCVVGTPAGDGTACAVDLPCRELVGACDGGFCRPSLLDCDDGNPCTDDYCDPALGGCQHAGTAVGEDRMCRLDSVCAAARCVGATCTVQGVVSNCAALNRRCRPDGTACGVCLPGYSPTPGGATNSPCSLPIDAGPPDAGIIAPDDAGVSCPVGFSRCGGSSCTCYGQCDSGVCQPWCGTVGTFCGAGQCCCSGGRCATEGTCECVS